MRSGLRRNHNPPVRFRLTLAGWTVVGALILVGVVAINSGLGLLFVMLGVMLGAVYVSAVLSRRMIAAVQVRREMPARCRQHERVHVGYVLGSSKRGGSCLALRVEELPVASLPVLPSACAYLPAQQSFFVRTEAACSHRGRWKLPGVRLSTTFPFGLIAARKVFDMPAWLVVWPARGRLRRGLLGKGEAHSTASTPSTRSGGSDEFFGLREYRPGDSKRWIHWRRSAGRGELVVREMSRPRPRTLWVVLDTQVSPSAGQDWSAREKAIRLAATIIEDALADGYRVGAAWAGRAESTLILPAERRGQLYHLLDALAQVDDNPHRTLGETVRRLRPGWLRHAHVVVIAAGAATEAEAIGGEHLARLRRESRNLTVIPAPRLAELFQDAEVPAPIPADDRALVPADEAAPDRAAKEAG